MALNKLYPPILDAGLPSITSSTLVIPFSHNPLVAWGDFTGYQIQIKTVQNTVVQLIEVDKGSSMTVNTITVVLGENVLPGNNYKVQIAYKSDDNIGYYSSAAVVHCAGYLSASIGLITKCDENGVRYIQGIYSHPDDQTEKLYSYRFTITKIDGGILLDTGELIHDTTNDTDAYSSTDKLEFNYDFGNSSDWNSYAIQYICTTINKTVVHSASQLLSVFKPNQRSSADTLLVLRSELVRDDAVNNIYINFTDNVNENNVNETNGYYILKRSDSSTDFKLWENVGNYIFTWTKKDLGYEQLIAVDYNVAAGKTYQYCLQQYNKNGVVSILFAQTSRAQVNFDDCFLYDGERQLKVAYNPRVASFKTTQLMNKTDTIGSKYPYIFMNGIVSYKEFPISGLLSYQSDPGQMFMTLEELGLSDLSNVRQKTNSEDDTYYYLPSNLEDIVVNAERRYKLMVLDFLNSSKPKLFKSPVEGNYLVQTLNASLSPNDTVGRMLHTFNCTAYEINDLINYQVKNILMSQAYFSTETTFSVHGQGQGAIDLTGKILTQAQISANANDIIRVEITDFKTRIVTEQQYIIGATGYYELYYNVPTKGITYFGIKTPTGDIPAQYIIHYWTKDILAIPQASSFDDKIVQVYQTNIRADTLQEDTELYLTNVVTIHRFTLLNTGSQPIVTVTINIAGQQEPITLDLVPSRAQSWTYSSSEPFSITITSNASVYYDIVYTYSEGVQENNG